MDIKTILTYLETKIPNFISEIKRNSYLFSCPNYKAHVYVSDTPTATFINGTDKIHCLACDFKDNIFGIVKVLEPDKKDWTDSKITNYLLGVCNIDMYKELDLYVQYKWALLPIAKNSKNPIEKASWKEISSFEKTDWIGWLEREDNIALDCGKSNVFIVDVDMKDLDKKTESQLEIRNKIIELLKASKTLQQNTPSGGTHYIFTNTEGFKQWVNIGGVGIDIRQAGGYVVIQPSKILGKNYNFFNLGTDIKEMPIELKDLLLSLPKNKLEVQKENIEPTQEEIIKINAGEGRNNILVSIGGILTHKYNPTDTEWFLNLINQKFFNPPLPSFEIKAMVGSLAGYKENKIENQKDAIYDYMKQMNVAISAKDVLENLQGLKLTRALVDKYFSVLVKEGKAVHWSRGYYKAKEVLMWTDEYPEKGKLYEYKIPFFNRVMEFEHGDIIILGGRPGTGKTHIAINMLKQMIDQNMKPYYVCLESGSRYGKIADAIQIPKKSFYIKEHDNPLSIALEQNAFTIIDWLNITEFDKTAEIHDYFRKELQNKGGVLVIFTQLKEDYSWFAPNLITQFPSFAARYQFDNPERTQGHWNVDKLRDAKGNYWNTRIECEYNPETKLFVAKGM